MPGRRGLGSINWSTRTRVREVICRQASRTGYSPQRLAPDPPNLRSRVRSALIALEDASTLQTLALPHYRLHPLTGYHAEFYALRMDRLQRIVFRFEDGNVHNLEAVGYHG